MSRYITCTTHQTGLKDQLIKVTLRTKILTEGVSKRYWCPRKIESKMIQLEEIQ
jgi:hypothetical protein